MVTEQVAKGVGVEVAWGREIEVFEAALAGIDKALEELLCAQLGADAVEGH